MNDRLLPIGTVVSLNKMDQKVCIIGYMDPITEETFKYYVGCLFPTGLKQEKTIGFTEEDIDNIYFMGYQTEETLKFTKLLKIIIDKFNSEE